MQEYVNNIAKEEKYKGKYRSDFIEGDTFDYGRNNPNYSIIQELQLAPSRVSELEKSTLLFGGDCGSCPSCACIEADFQALAVIEAPATVPLLITVGGIRIAS